MHTLVGAANRPRVVVAVFLLTLGYLSAFAGVLTRIGDEGTLLTGAALTAAGAVPYRDFADLANPLSYYWLAAWFSLFGTTFAVARVQLVLTGAVSAMLVYVLTARAYGTRAGLTAAAMSAVLSVPFWPGTNHHWDSNLFYLITLTVLAVWQTRPSVRLAGLAGLAAAATSGFVIDKGGVALLVALVVMWRQRDLRVRASAAAIAGFVVGLAVMAAPFLWHGAMTDFIYVNIVFPATQYEGTRRTMPYAFYFVDLAWSGPLSILTRIFPLGVAHGLAVVLAVPLLCVVVAPLVAVVVVVRQCVGSRMPWDDARTLLWVGGSGLLVSELHRWDTYHLIYGTPVLVGALLGELLAQANHGWRRGALRVITACTLMLAVWQTAQAQSAQIRQVTRRGVVRVHARDEALQFLVDHTKPGDDVFVYPYYGMYYFLADVRNPTRFAILMNGYNTAAQFRESIERLEQAKPRFVLWDTTVDGDKWMQWYPDYHPPAPEDRVIEQYLSRHYRQIDTKNAFRVLERIGPAGDR